MKSRPGMRRVKLPGLTEDRRQQARNAFTLYAWKLRKPCCELSLGETVATELWHLSPAAVKGEIVMFPAAKARRPLPSPAFAS